LNYIIAASLLLEQIGVIILNIMSTDNLQPNQRMRPGVKALIVHDDKILMIHEHVMRKDVKVDIADFPGGGIDFGENLIDALKREVFEEVGLKIEPQKVVGAWDFVLGAMEHSDKEKQGTHIVCIGYQCKLLGEPVIDTTNNPAPEDIFDAKWYTKEELLANKDMFNKAPEMLQAVKNLSI